MCSLLNMGATMDSAEQAKAKREQAAQARRWARILSLADDRKQLERHAEELDREAAELERQAAAVPAPPSRTVMTQQQPQQQQATEAKSGAKYEDPKS